MSQAPVNIRRVFYSYNNQLDIPYYLNVFVKAGDKTLVNFVEEYKTLEEFNTKIEGLLPLLAENENENRQEQAQDVGRDSEDLQVRESSG